MKQTLIGTSLLILLCAAYLHLPLHWRRHKDIEHGNRLIANVQAYQRDHGSLPENGEAETLKRLGFAQNKQGWQPGYTRTGPSHFQIQYADGYTAPYLTWRSDQPHWHTAPARP